MGENNISFTNDDTFLLESVKKINDDRKEFGLNGLVGGLNAIIINVEKENHTSAVQELLDFTGYDIKESFENDDNLSTVLKLDGSADILVQYRKSGVNPFLPFNVAPKTNKMPNTRLETFVFVTTNIKKYVEIQKNRGIEFQTDEIIEKDNYMFIQSKPSTYTGVSVGIIEWKNSSKKYSSNTDHLNDLDAKKPKRFYHKNIGRLDHTATRVRAKDRDAAIVEFMNLTNYNFEFAIYVKSFNSITNVARLSANDFAMVFTSGISPYKNEEESGPTEKYIHNFNTRTHHMAFTTENIEDTYIAMKKDGLEYLVELVGSPDEGLKQTFTNTSPSTFLVNEYIHRYGDFDGFFTKNNVTLLTESTEKQ